ncbi:MAG: AAA family ATPase [Candidatus Coatesbacteria bacterium]|nr:AAA family ATPase [Candidatus Coatesbacteria bacterium]
MKTIAFFNNKGGVGKTSLVYHLAYMYAELGLKVIAADLDPQANLTSMFLEDERLEEVWPDGEHPETIAGALQPLIEGTGRISQSHVESISDSLGLLIGDLALSSFEDDLSENWPHCLSAKPRAFRIEAALFRSIQLAAAARGAELVLIDVGPNLGAINRAAMIASRYVAVPLAPDLFSLQGLRNLGPTLRRWRSEWTERLDRRPVGDLELPMGEMEPIGYITMQHAVRIDRPTKAYSWWANRIPGEYGVSVLNKPREVETDQSQPDSNCLALLKHYRSLMPMAMEARKPIFALKPADGAIGAHVYAVQQCAEDFNNLAVAIAERCEISLPRTKARFPL